MTYLYVAISLYADEAQCFTVGITKDPLRRSYEKHMQIIMMQDYKYRKQARAAEKALLAWCNANFEKAFVRFGVLDMANYSKNRTADWFYNPKSGAPLDAMKEVI